MSTQQLKEVLAGNTSLRPYLFIRGFLVTDAADVNDKAFPFYGGWSHCQKGRYHFYTHPLTPLYFAEVKEDCWVYLLGHAYNPFTMQHEEEVVLQKVAAHYGQDDFYEAVSELTGIFVMGVIDGDTLYSLVDPSGMQSACTGVVGGNMYLSSHPQLVADLTGLQMDGFVEELIHYKWYARVMGAYLPGDLTPFAALKRIVPNIEYRYDTAAITHKRFYPLTALPMCETDEDYRRVIEEGATILKNNMALIARKWNRPGISLTGGIDSNTVFAAANGVYDRFETFSYLSAHKETIDCDAAQKISAHFQVPWTLYTIPENPEGSLDFEGMMQIINHNNGYIVQRKENEYKKRVYLTEHLDFDVEVKGWTSETIRAYWYKHYGRKKMPRLSPKLFRNLYKIFLFNRRLAHKVDKVFADYIDQYEYRTIPSDYLPADLHYNEVTWGSWGGLNISEMKMYADIAIPYNNRKFLDLLLRVPLEKRISDRHHLDMKQFLNPALYDLNIRVVNMEETNFRAFALNVIFTLNSFLPF